MAGHEWSPGGPPVHDPAQMQLLLLEAKENKDRLAGPLRYSKASSPRLERRHLCALRPSLAPPPPNAPHLSMPRGPQLTAPGAALRICAPYKLQEHMDNKRLLFILKYNTDSVSYHTGEGKGGVGAPAPKLCTVTLTGDFWGDEH